MTQDPSIRHLHRDGPPRHYLHVARHRMPSGAGDLTAHDHDFVEVFWVEAGEGGHLENGCQTPLVAGDCVFIRAEDRHSFCNPGREDLVWTNVTLDRATEGELRRRHAAELGWWPWAPGGPIRRARLTPVQVADLGVRAAALPVGVQRRLDLDWFLAGLLRVLLPADGPVQREAPPVWLAEALRLLRQPEHLQAGLAAFRRLAGVSPEHLNRSVRRHYGCTARDLLCQLRLEAAARALRFGDRGILAISLDCGFENLSCFYRRFRACFGTTPRTYRRGPHSGPRGVSPSM
jgi:AraC family cel operon transcriptional repressor